MDDITNWEIAFKNKKSVDGTSEKFSEDDIYIRRVQNSKDNLNAMNLVTTVSVFSPIPRAQPDSL